MQGLQELTLCEEMLMKGEECWLESIHLEGMTIAIRVVHRGVGDQHSILVREHYEAVRHQQSIRPRRIGGGHGPDYVALVINLNEPAGASQRVDRAGTGGTHRASRPTREKPRS